MHDLRSECKIKVVGWYEECEGVVFVICLFMEGGEGVVFFNLKRFFRFSFATKLEKELENSIYVSFALHWQMQMQALTSICFAINLIYSVLLLSK